MCVGGNKTHCHGTVSQDRQVLHKIKYNFSTKVTTKKKKIIKITPRLVARNDMNNIIKNRRPKHWRWKKIRNFFGTAQQIFI